MEKGKDIEFILQTIRDALKQNRDSQDQAYEYKLENIRRDLANKFEPLQSWAKAVEEKLSEQQDQLEKIRRDRFRASPNIIKLNVGGRYFVTTIETIQKSPVLTNEVDKAALDDSGCKFLDRDPKLFEIILAFLRKSSRNKPISQINIPEDQILLLDLVEECEDLQLTEFAERLHDFQQMTLHRPTQIQIVTAIQAASNAGKGVNFAGANFRNLNLSLLDFGDGANLQRADLTNVDFSNTYLAKAKFTGANLSNTSFLNAHLYEADFSRMDLSGRDFTGLHLAHARFVGCKLSGCRFDNAALYGADFTQAMLGPDHEAGLGPADFSRANLRQAKFLNAVCTRVVFRDVGFGDASMYRDSTYHARFDRAVLDGAVFTGADLKCTNVTDAQRATIVV